MKSQDRGKGRNTTCATATFFGRGETMSFERHVQTSCSFEKLADGKREKDMKSCVKDLKEARAHTQRRLWVF